MLIVGIDPGALTGWAVVDCSASRPTVLSSGTELREAFYDSRRLIPRDHSQMWWNAVDAYAIQVPFILGVDSKVPVWNAKSAVSLAKQAACAYRLVGHLQAVISVPLIVVPPLRGIGAKMSAEAWKQIFQHEGRLPSEHARDAACLALHAQGMVRQAGKRWVEIGGKA